MAGTRQTMIQALGSYSPQSPELNPQILWSEGICRIHCCEVKSLTFNRPCAPSMSQRGGRGRNYVISTSYLNNFREGQNKPSFIPSGHTSPSKGPGTRSPEGGHCMDPDKMRGQR